MKAPNLISRTDFPSPYAAMDTCSIGSPVKASDWTGGVSSSDALVWGRHGNADLVAPSDALMERFESLMPETARKRWTHDIAGALPDVPRFLAGNDPRTMRRRRMHREDSAPIRVYVDMTCSGGVSAEDQAKRGAVALAFVRMVSAHRPLDLYAFFGSTDGDGWNVMTIPLPSAPLNVSLAAAWLSHAGVFRAAMLNWYCQKTGWRGGGRGAQSDQVDTVKTLLGLGADDVYIPGGYLGDPMITNPEKTLRAMLERAGVTEGD